jgi:peroxiredoxin
LQENLAKFDARSVSVVLVSVETPEITTPWAQDKGFTFPMASDPELKLIGALDLENPDVEGLALHAVFLLEEDGTVFYRKIARRRAYSREFIDAIDYHYGRGRFAPPAAEGAAGTGR